MFSDAIDGLSGIRAVRDVIGDDTYGLFLEVAFEKEKEQPDEWFKAISAMAPGAEQYGEMIKWMRWSMDTAEKEIRNDKRILDAFSGLQDELNALILGTKTWMQSMFASSVLHATREEGGLQ